jgi:CRISPR/Cas system type I-B associated protein Csh2 (Cas7 group RAMP superfamily)
MFSGHWVQTSQAVMTYNSQKRSKTNHKSQIVQDFSHPFRGISVNSKTAEMGFGNEQSKVLK